MIANKRVFRVPILAAALFVVSLGGARGPAQAGQAQRSCISRSGVASPVIREDGRLYFRGQPNWRQSYIVVFKADLCRKLNPMGIVSLETDGSRVCEGDKVRISMNASQIPGPACVIGHLEPFAGDVDDPVKDPASVNAVK